MEIAKQTRGTAWRRVLNALLALVMVVGVVACAVPLFALPVIAAETEGDFIYTVSDNKATIIGYTGSAIKLVIPSTLGGYPVVAIAYEGLFAVSSSLESVTIPKSVTSIGGGAFIGCLSLTRIDVDSSNGNYASRDGVLFNKSFTKLITCPGDKQGSYTIPDSVTSIGDYAFTGCTSLTSITIPNGVTSIGDCAFEDCYNLTTITIPDGVTSIGDSAFFNCRSLTSITIPDSVTSIGDYAFTGCTSLTSITIPNGVTSIGGGAFSHCTSLKSITIPDSVTSIGYQAFQGCTSLTSITIPNGVTSIGGGAFSHCTSLKSITIPDSVTSIGECAFYGCSSLTSITIPNSVTSIGYQAFNDCPSLTAYAYENSYAQKYCKAMGFHYVIIGATSKNTTKAATEATKTTAKATTKTATEATTKVIAKSTTGAAAEGTPKATTKVIAKSTTGAAVEGTPEVVLSKKIPIWMFVAFGASVVGICVCTTKLIKIMRLRKRRGDRK